MGWLGGKGRPGWVKAPPTIELEIRGVWQEDELPDEIKLAPGHATFTLGTESQEWVDSMEEIVDGGDAVYGRPKPASSPTHKSLTTPPPPQPLPPPAAPTYSLPYHPQSNRTTIWPDRPRVQMPDIYGSSAPPSMPPSHPRAPRDLMPDIEAAPPPLPAGPSSTPHAGMPDIGDASPSPARVRTLPRRILVPEIGVDVARADSNQAGCQKPAMPDIGGDDEDTSETKRGRRSMPDIG